jgi:hypothetical protein
LKKVFLFLFFAPISIVLAQKNVEHVLEESYIEEKVFLEKKPSIISIPFEISIEDLQNQINNGMPDLIFEDNSFTDNNNDDFKAKVWRKGNLIFTSIKEDVFFYEVPLKIWAQKRISAFGISQAPATEFEIKLKFSSKFSISPNYNIETLTNSNGFVWITKPSLKTTYVEIPISAIIGKLIDNNQAMFAKEIDKTIYENFSLKPYISSAWQSASKPFLASQEYNTWVKIEPQEIFMTPLKSSGQNLKSTLGIKVLVETSVGTPKLSEKTETKIPNLRPVNTIPEVFEISLFNVISYEEASNISNKMFGGQKYEFKNGKYKIEITNISIFGSNEYIVLQTTTKGSFKGTIFIKGIPVYDKSSNSVLLTNTQIDIKTKNFLHKAASWLLEGTLEKKVEKEFSIPLNEIIGFAKESVLSTINSDFAKGIKMKGEILEIVPNEVKVSPDGILATINSKAKVQLIIKGM